uniref:Uncharacterized protein n=1 Tax=Anopheles arabiensis TaxID=7173 RepID=A0A182HXM8_ANOAR
MYRGTAVVRGMSWRWKDRSIGIASAFFTKPYIQIPPAELHRKTFHSTSILRLYAGVHALWHTIHFIARSS